MATEQEQQRRRRLDELELYEQTQVKLLVWSKRQFWWVIAFGSLTLGSGGYLLVNTMLSDVTDDATEAMFQAKFAAEEITKAKDAASEAVANAKKKIILKMTWLQSAWRNPEVSMRMGFGESGW